MLTNSCALLILSTRGLLGLFLFQPMSSWQFHLYFCREWTDHPQHRCFCGHYSSGDWHHSAYCWIPSWSSSLPLHQEAPNQALQAWDILSPTATGSSTTAASWSRVWGGSWTEREWGLWSSTEYWTEAMWGLCDCAALIVTKYQTFTCS